MQNPQRHEFMPQTLLRDMTNGHSRMTGIDYSAHARFPQDAGALSAGKCRPLSTEPRFQRQIFGPLLPEDTPEVRCDLTDRQTDRHRPNKMQNPRRHHVHIMRMRAIRRKMADHTYSYQRREYWISATELFPTIILTFVAY